MKRRLLPFMYRKKVASLPWYLDGGVDISYVTSAYQPFGAISYEASLLSLNGGLDLTNPGVLLTFDPLYGWLVASGGVGPYFDAFYSDYSTAILLYAIETTGFGTDLCGVASGVSRLNLGLYDNDGKATYGQFGNAHHAVSICQYMGVVAISKNGIYQNGIRQTDAFEIDAFEVDDRFYLGGAWDTDVNEPIPTGVDIKIGAFALYASTLLDATILAISNRLLALSGWD